MNELNLDYTLFIPEFLLVGLVVLVVGLDLFAPQVRKSLLSYATAAGLAATAGISLAWIDVESDFAGVVAVDNYTTFFRVFFMLGAAVIALASGRLVEERLRHPGEYYGLLTLATIGAIGMAASRELMTAYLSLELLSFSSYVLVSYQKYEGRSNEAGLKYMLLGAFSSALLLYGLSLIYGIAGSTYYSDVSAALGAGTSEYEWAMLMGIVLVITGLGFKVAAVPFHMWTPDAYEGAPVAITMFLSTISKAAGFALLLRLFSGAFEVVHDDWSWMIAGISAATMILGNLVALQQHNIKRLMAYSSIGQVGYMLMGIAGLSHETASALVLHMTGYMISNMVVFVVIIAWYVQTGKEEIDEFRGMRERAPLLAGALAGALFSLAGLPLFAGFVTKFILFQAAVDEGYLWLAGIGVTTSVVSLYYYLQVMRRAFVDAPAEGETERLRIPYVMQGLAVILMLGVFYVGLYPQGLFDIVDNATAFLFV
ncbi:MAG TPA: NADH-quinone oxidoreductase subunit N [Dehalococcoidia bacterium]|nr:NADH-quinone oxidoreductase subunit N [Dehalococcoidia bacterium]